MTKNISNQTITGPLGFRAGSTACGLKASGNLDLAVLACDVPATAAGVFTTNKVFAAPVALCREHLSSGKAQALVVNAGNANACTGSGGLADARSMASRLAKALSVPTKRVLVASTGVIGRPLPMNKVFAGIDAAMGKLSNSTRAGREFARAIMTTDRYPKAVFRQLRLGRSIVRLAGVAKGAGMIAPNMATMLCFITTDAAISTGLLRRLLKSAVDCSFNAITVDNHMSTNDTAIILASGLAGNRAMTSLKTAGKFSAALDDVCLDLALQMVSDGEGATRRMDITVCGARSATQARIAALAVANSPLVKCALFGGDPNWGRIVSAVGACAIDCRQELMDCRIGPLIVMRQGRPLPADHRKLSKIMAARVVPITVDLNLGTGRHRCYGCDLSNEYVHINADYHT